MKKAFLLITISAMLMNLAGCKAKRPAAAVDGAPWSEDWITFGVLGVEEPGHGLTLRDDKAAKEIGRAHV